MTTKPSTVDNLFTGAADDLLDDPFDYVCVVFAVDEFGNESRRVISNKVTTMDLDANVPVNTFKVTVVETGNFLARIHH